MSGNAPNTSKRAPRAARWLPRCWLARCWPARCWPALCCLLTIAAVPASARGDEPLTPTPAAPPSGAVETVVQTVVPTFRGGPSDQALVPGAVPLFRRDADALAALVEEAFGVTLSGKLHADLVEGLRVDFRALGARGRQGWLELTDPFERLREDARSERGEQVEAGLQQFRLRLDERMRVRPQVAPHVLIARILKRHNVVAWPGHPPVTGEAEDVYLDALVFFGILGRNEDIALSEGQEQVMREHLRAHFAEGPKEDREAVQTLPRLWRHVRARWHHGGATARADLRMRIVRLLGQLPPPGRQVIVPASVGGDDATYAHWAERARKAQDRFAALTNLGRNPRHVTAILRAGLGLPGALAASTLGQR